MLQGKGEILLVKEDWAILDWKPETQRLAGYVKLKGIAKTEFRYEYLKAEVKAQEYLSKYTAKELLKILGIEGRKIKEAELLPLQEANEALLDFKMKDIDMAKAMELNQKFLEMMEKLQNPTEVEKLVNTAFDAIKVKNEKEAQRYGAFIFSGKKPRKFGVKE